VSWARSFSSSAGLSWGACGSVVGVAPPGGGGVAVVSSIAFFLTTPVSPWLRKLKSSVLTGMPGDAQLKKLSSEAGTVSSPVVRIS
jgi:hypothetical protein